MIALNQSDVANGLNPVEDALHSRGETARADLGDLQAAAAAARAARDSLRRLLTALCAAPLEGSLGSCGSELSLAAAACSADPEPDGVQRVAAKRARFERSAAEFEAAALAASVASPLTLGVRAQGVRARRVPTIDHAEQLDLAPRLRLQAPDGSGGLIAVALWHQAAGAEGHQAAARLAVVLGSGRLELWERDLFSWHCLASADSFQSCTAASLSFAAEGTLLWVVVAPVSDGGAQVSRLSLFSCDGGAGSLCRIALADCPSFAPWAAGPVPVAVPGAEVVALALSADGSSAKVPWLQLWSAPANGQADLLVVASCSLGDPDTAVAGLWALPASPDPLLVVWLRFGCGPCGEFQVRSCSGHVLASLPLSAEVRHLVVPPQGPCPAEAAALVGAGSSSLPPFAVLAERGGPASAEWAAAVVVAERQATEGQATGDAGGNKKTGLPMSLRVKPLLVVFAPAPCSQITGVCESLVACRSAGSAPYLLDWQNGRTHPLPGGSWLPVAVAPSTVVLRGRPEAGADDELLLLEPR